MKKILSLILFALSFNSLTAQEAFYIENYHVDIQLYTNGSFDVTETIDVFFTEKRRGIIRDIPCRYTFDTITPENRNEYALGATSTGKYNVLIDSINVEGYNFSVIDNGYNKSIRIGSADQYISGAHKYIIKYTVWGAINDFVDHSEFSWNIIGHEWKTEIKKATFTLSFQNKTKLEKGDIKVFSGKQGNKDNLHINYTQSNKYIKGKTKKGFQAGEGATLIVKLPTNYFNNRYRVNKHADIIYLEKDGSYDVQNIQKVEYIGYNQYTLNRLPLYTNKPVKKENKYHISYKYNYYTSKNHIIVFNGNRTDKNKYNQKQVYKHFDYNLLNGKTSFNNGEGLLIKWDINQFYQKPDTLIIKLELLKHAKPISLTLTKNGEPVKYDLNGAEFYSRITDIKQNDIVLLKVVYPKWTYSEALPPKHAIYDILNTFVITKFDDEIFINKDATIRIKRKYYVDFRESIAKGEKFPFTIEVNKETPIYLDYSRSYHRYIIEDVKYGNANYIENYSGFKLNWGKNENEKTRKGVFEFEYTTYDMLRKDGDKFLMDIPLYENYNSPAIKGSLKIHFPEKIENNQLAYGLTSLYESESPYIINELGFNDTIYQLDFKLRETVMYAQECPLLSLRFPKGSIKTSFTKDTRIFIAKSEDEILSLIIPIAITLILFLLWFFLGKDEKYEIDEKQYIPDNISPPEVGYIWDGKLHKRDLIALIYHWAGQGIIKISDFYLDEDDITLNRIKDLPKDRKKFEQTIFKGLFNYGDKVNVSDLRDSFYRTMDKAGIQFKNYSKRNKLLMPGTRAFGRILMIIGIITGLITLFTGLAEENTFITIYSFLLAAPFIVFGILMPKFGHLGAKMHREILGFKKFIEHAEVDRLMFILEEDPDYFDKTVAYAIVMGMGKTWANKFNGLIKSKGIETNNTKHSLDELPEDEMEEMEDKLDTLFYVNSIMKRMHKIEDDFHYKKPPARSSYSSSSSSSYNSYSYKSSSSYSSSSSSSYSGSSSYGSSSGSSGSGYGGGGGSSW